MMRLVLAIVAAMALSGCQHGGQQAIDPFWGRTTVPAPATGSIGAPIISPGCQQPLTPQVTITPGTPTPLSSGALPPASPPNLLPAPMSPPPGGTVPITPIPATPGPSGNGVPYGYGTPPMTSPPSGYPPSRAPLSGYSNPDSSTSGSPGSPAVTMPGSGPAGTYPPPPTTPSGMTPPTGGAAPVGPSPGSSSPTGPGTTPTPAGSPSSGGAPGYFPPGGFNYDNRSGSARPSPGGNLITPNGVATVPVSLDGATVSAPPETTTQPGVPGTPGLDASPSVVRIPAGADGGWAQHRPPPK